MYSTVIDMVLFICLTFP